MAVCVKKPLEKVVPEHHCERKHKPVPRSVRCGRTPCPAEWSPGEWSVCSASCVQDRRILCRQQLTQTLTIVVAEGACMKPQNFPTMRPCTGHLCVDGEAREVLATQPKLEENQIYQKPQRTNNNFYSNYLSNERFHSDHISKKERYPGLVRDKERYPVNPPGKKVLLADWTAQPWGPCSITCGAGVKERRVRTLLRNGWL